MYVSFFVYSLHGDPANVFYFMTSCNGQEEESDSDYSGDLYIMVEDREDQEEDGCVFDSVV